MRRRIWRPLGSEVPGQGLLVWVRDRFLYCWIGRLVSGAVVVVARRRLGGRSKVALMLVPDGLVDDHG